MISFSISLTKSENAEQIRSVQNEVWLATFPNKEYGISVEAIQAQFTDKEMSLAWINQVKEALATDKNTHGWIAKVEKKIVAYCFVKKYEDKNRIMAIYVLPQYQKQGIGKALMERMLDWIDKTKPTVLEVAEYNANAIAFYKLFGFVENGPTKNEVAALQTGIVIPVIEMIKRN